MTAERSHGARWAGVGAALAATLLLGGCGAAPSPAPTASPTASPSATPTASPSPTATAGTSSSPSPGGSPSTVPTPGASDAGTYAAIEDQVAAERGLRADARLVPTVLDETALRERMEKDFAEENPPEEIHEGEVFLAAMGLLPAGASLRDLYLELMGSQVAGFYDLEANEMFVVARSGGIGPSERATFAHEYVHALQDQRFQADRLVDDAATKGHGDRALAWRSVVEGDASLVQLLWLQKYLTSEEIATVLEESSDPEAQAILDRAPAILRESLMFPYVTGTQFVIGVYMKGGWEAVNALYAALPASTEQVLHPDKYAAGEAPREVSVPAADLARALGAGWTVADEDTLGEFFLGTWLDERGASGPAAVPSASPTAATRPAAGWGGDRSLLLLGPGDAHAIVLATAWDTAGDADEFAVAARAAVRGLPGATAVRAVGDAVTVLLTSDAAVLERLKAALP